MKVAFDKLEGYDKLVRVSPVAGSEEVVAPGDLANGFWIIPGHGTLFVWKKATAEEKAQAAY